MKNPIVAIQSFPYTNKFTVVVYRAKDYDSRVVQTNVYSVPYTNASRILYLIDHFTALNALLQVRIVGFRIREWKEKHENK